MGTTTLATFRGVPVIVALWLAAALPHMAAAQETLRNSEQFGRVTIRLLDAQSASPIAGAFIEISPTGHRAFTDSTGTASFFQLPPGSLMVAVRHLGYGEHEVPFESQGMTTSVLAIELEPNAIALEPIEVAIEHRPRDLEDVGFYARRAVGWGEYFDPQFVERWGKGVWAAAPAFLSLVFDFSPRFRYNRPSCLGVQIPIVYLDGVRLNDGMFWLETYSSWDFGAVEVYSGASGLPDFSNHPDDMCGMVAVWSNTWRGRNRQLGGAEVELCDPEKRDRAIVEGFIRDEFTEVMLPGAHVLATSYPADDTRARRQQRIVSDKHGRYRICDVPPDHTLTVQVEVGPSKSVEHHVDLEERLVHHDLTVRMSGPGQVVGRVMDRSTGRPVAAADVSVRGTVERTQTDELGYFKIDRVLPGDHVVEIAHLGFEPVEQSVSVIGSRTVEVRAELSADPIELEPLVVTLMRDRRLENRGFYDRRTLGERTGLGTFMDQEDIDKQVAARTSSLLQMVPGIQLNCSGSNCRVGTSRLSSCREMSVYINGSLTLGEGRRDPVSLDEIIRPSEIGAMEIYPGASSVPAEFSGTSGRCGAIVIWTR